MNLEQQVVSLELAKRLKELGVKQESFFYWTYHLIDLQDAWWVSTKGLKVKENEYSAFTVAELGEMLPWKLDIGDDYYELELSKDGTEKPFIVCYNHFNHSGNVDAILGDEYYTEKTEADARAKMLIYLIENKLVTL